MQEVNHRSVGLLDRIAAFVGGVIDVHVFVSMSVLLSRKAEAVRVSVVLVAVKLREEQVNTGVNQAQVGDVAQALMTGCY